ncbi:MAG: transglycosylase SLT domain-containing protein, partial [Gammaproteobacteria bacterium]|nr:transglycosylase SLT domain-containing protein [Gammaproteobacteria bacterium]
MKENLILMSFSALLLASSGILSQPTDEISSTTVFDTPDQQTSAFISEATSAKINKTSPLMLAKVNEIDVTRSHQLNSNKIEAITDIARIKTAIEDATTETKTANAVAELPTKSFSDEEIALQRQLFLQAESALKKKDDASYFLLSDQLKDYPLYPYLQYQWLRKNLDRERQVQHFLQQHSSSRYAPKLKYKWLQYLGRHKQWSLLLENKITTKDVTLSCYFHRAELNTGNKSAALAGAQQLWAVGHSQPKVCDPLFSQLKKSVLFTQYLRWQRFDAALKNKKVSLAKYIRTLMPDRYHATAQLWLNLHRDPARYMPQLLSQPQSSETALMFRHSIDRLAGKDIIAAIEIWDANKQRFTINKQLAEKLERRLALKLVFERESGAYERLGQLDEQSNSSRTWRVRIALIEQNWSNVLTAIHALSNKEKADEKWQYWLARAHIETDKPEMAQPLLIELANKRSFYGFLAADKINSLYQLSENPIMVSAEEITALKNQDEFRVAFEFMVLDRKNDAKIQWWHATRLLSTKEIIIAAKLAQQWQWDEIAIFTVAKAKHWDDIELRFPLSYTDKILKNSVQQKLNPAILFGLVRRESAFNEKAYSPVGARGLMQIMPGTGRQIAKNLNERWRGSNSLYNPETNIKYGAFYYQKLLNQFDGNYAIALAAYNAGPKRVNKWLPETESMPADIWIETIPYKETREYVINVLAYALIYQQR